MGSPEITPTVVTLSVVTLTEVTLTEVTFTEVTPTVVTLTVVISLSPSMSAVPRREQWWGWHCHPQWGDAERLCHPGENLVEVPQRDQER